MLAHRPIRHKLIFMLFLLLVFITAGSLASLIGFYTYRDTVKSVSLRAKELPYATELMRWVSDLRVIVKEVESIEDYWKHQDRPSFAVKNLQDQFNSSLRNFHTTLQTYTTQMNESTRQNSVAIGSSEDERQTVRNLGEILQRIHVTTREPAWTEEAQLIQQVNDDLRHLQQSSAKLPKFLHTRLDDLSGNVRVQYWTFIYTTWACILLATVTIFLFIRLFVTWIFRPLTILINGSRRVATGDFDFRIKLTGEDEMTELADAMNNMTEQFQHIQNDLYQQVEQRTIQMVRTEKMASVGFLAAGVAHEINNPMASIALCADALEQRLVDHGPIDAEERNATKKYIQMIQDEAFRCKGITDQLLDFSRKGDDVEEHTDLRELIQVVVDMVVTLTKSQRKQISFEECKSVMIVANPQEIKQVILNLINNAMESVEAGGHVRLKLDICDEMAEIIVSDNGCGMTDEVRQHLFEPFFTKRRHGQGTGLGLTIAYGIVRHHGGQMEAMSDGPSCGSQFRVLLPLAGNNSNRDFNQHNAA